MSALPITVKRALELIGLYFLGTIIFIGADVITPLIMAFFIAIVLLPIHRYLRRKKFPEMLAITCSLLALVIIVAGIGWFLSSQIAALVSDFPQIKENVLGHLHSISDWINKKTNFSSDSQLKLLNDQSNKLLNYAGNMLGGAAGSLTSIFIFIGLLPIYIFLILYYKNLLIRFVFLWFPEENHNKVKDVMHETEIILKSYLVGLLIQITYISILVGGILMLFGIQHALLIGVIFAILNLIPYVGALIGNFIGVLLTLTSSANVWPIFVVLGTIAFVQFLDNNILMPRIVGSKVKINALATIVGVIIAGALTGVSGMFLSLPIIAVLKVIFDRTERFRQWGVLLGDERPKASPIQFPLMRRKNNNRIAKKPEPANNIKTT